MPTCLTCEIFHDSTPHATARALGALRLLRPYQITKFDKVRLGRYNDGGYVMVNLFSDTEAAYSLGINDDVSWDLDVASMGIPVYQYDHTIEQLPDTHPLFQWEKIGISGVSDVGSGFATLAELIERNGHTQARNLLLKCDIESAEWLLLAKTPNAVLRQFRQIVMEIHRMEFLGMEEHADNIRRAFLNLTHSHNVVHVHANNYSPWISAGGVPVPNNLEITLLRDDVGDFAVSNEIFPTPLDMPCDPHRADLYLGKFEY